jgi:crotonobetaine/carnitine-CoA ligase
MFTIFSAFMAHAWGMPRKPFLCVPAAAGRPYHPDGLEWSYMEVAERVLDLQARYRAAGFGHGHRVALSLENRPEFVVHWFALNGLGASVVPINPDYRRAELSYLLEHAEPDLVVALAERVPDLIDAGADVPGSPPVRPVDGMDSGLPAPRRAAKPDAPGALTEATLVYTSGTTGRPKGCVQTNHYMLAAAQWYASRGGTMAVVYGAERLYTPMPLFHMAALGLNTLGMMVTANCLILTDRFHPRRWWPEIVQTRATIVHYLGVIPAMLLEQPPVPDEKRHGVKFGLGGGVSAELHARFETRFGFHLNEGWAMTESGRGIYNNYDPRKSPRVFGRAEEGFEARVVDDHDRDVPPNTPGELVVRFDGPDARWGFTAGYLKNETATEDAWRGGWFHTGDTVCRNERGEFRFLDRKKNIIRRSGENIAAAEVEMVLAAHPAIARCAVIAVPDEIRQEEVMACVVLADNYRAAAETAQDIFEWCNRQLAYYKAPGWILFVDSLPMTSTHKIQKTRIFPPDEDPRTRPGIFDLRAGKKRIPSGASAPARGAAG